MLPLLQPAQVRRDHRADRPAVGGAVGVAADIAENRADVQARAAADAVQGVALLGGVWAALPAFQAEMPPLYFALTCMGASVLIMIARVTHQKGLPDD